MSTWTDNLTMETMAKERANPPFDVRKMSIEHHGSESDLIKKEKFMLEASRDPVFYSADIYDLTKEQIRERTMQRIQRLAHYVTSESVDDFQKRMELMSLLDPGLWTRLGVHYGLFLGAIRSGATPNQFSYWMEKGVIGCNGMFGCFGMTELAHGSNVAGLETTAHFDVQTDEFVIHTPNLGATKWWIGGAAQTATHCSVFAQLIVKGKRYGTKTFIVPLRDPKSFQLLPGINIGDIGKKMGRDGIDNGYIQFTNVRIPRAYMLMKHTQVTRDGEVREPPLQQLTYGALLQGRTAMVADAANTAKKALTISVRYAAARRQFKSDAKAEYETQILDYPIHQRRLMPLLAQSVAFGYTALELQRLFEETSQALEALEPGDPNLDATIEKLKETHSTSAGLKAFCTWATLETIDRSRQACGGHGYSSYNGFANMYSDFAVHCLIKGTKVLTVRANGLTPVCVEDLRTGDALLDEHGQVTRVSTPVLPIEADTRSIKGVAEAQEVMAYQVTPGHLLSLRCDCTPYRIHTSPHFLTAHMQWASRNEAGQVEWRWTNFSLRANGDLVKGEFEALPNVPALSASGLTSSAVETSSRLTLDAMARLPQPQFVDSPPASPVEKQSDAVEWQAETSTPAQSSHPAEADTRGVWSHSAFSAEVRQKCSAWFEEQPDRVRLGDIVDIAVDDYAALDASHPFKTIFGGFRGRVADVWPAELAETALPTSLQTYRALLDPYFLGFWLGDGSHESTRVYPATHQTQVIDKLRAIYEPQGFEVRVYKQHGRRVAHAEVDLSSGADEGVGDNSSDSEDQDDSEWASGCLRVAIVDLRPPRARSNRLLDALRAFGLTGLAGRNKHIPPAYLYGSADVRRQVLAGLIDSDGCLPVLAEPRRENVYVWQFSQAAMHDRLFDDALTLGRSLGLVHTGDPQHEARVGGVPARRLHLAGHGQELVSAHIQLPYKRLAPFDEVSVGQRRRAQIVVTGHDSTPQQRNQFYSFQVDGNTRRFLLADWTTVHNCTWEGDNTILALQSGRFLISAYQDALDGKKQVSSGTKYLNDLETVLSAKCKSNEDLDTLEGIDRGWATVAAHAVKKASEDYQACLKAGRSREQAFEDCSQVRFVAASVHTSGYIFRQFRSAVERVEKSGDGVREHLELLAKFYGLWQMEEKAAFFLRSGWLTADQLDYASAKVTEYCSKTRSFAIPLIDSFAISDHVLNSPIGRYDGDIYREYFRMVRRNNPQLKEHPYFERLIRPFIERQPAEMEDFDEAIGIDDEIEEIKQDREEAEAEAKAAAEGKKE